jgi:hypothetical protein
MREVVETSMPPSAAAHERARDPERRERFETRRWMPGRSRQFERALLDRPLRTADS